ncbi:coiled-coil domain-containing protein 190 [Trichomycterus rosablanca]|uniref:coiled-coil domain-containing protein 190 n=1 Tax=Trichomycterus rosablanca TaxID=2290929 RepID=UPI002F357EA7
MRRADWLVVPSEAQRREERRAEARLADGLQRLDEVRRYHINTLTREQRAIHRHLLALKAGNRWRNLNTVGFQPTSQNHSHPAVPYKKTLLPIIPPSGREAERHRSGKPQSVCSLQARVQEFISSGESRVDNSTVPFCLPDLKLQPTNCTTLPPAASDRDNGRNRDRDGQREAHRDRDRQGPRSEQTTETFSYEENQRENELIVAGDKNREREDMEVTMSPSTPSSVSQYVAPNSHKRMVHTLPNFAQALVEARKARYIRHHGQPLCEKELSIREIFSKNSKDSPTTY